jgi:2-enoate reductase
MKNKYEALFTPMKIGGVTVKNRIVLCAMGGTGPFGHDGRFNEKIKAYYLDRAKANVGLIIPGVTAVLGLDKCEDIMMGPIKDMMDRSIPTARSSSSRLVPALAVRSWFSE